MSKFIITSDTTCDLPKDFCKSNNIDIHPLYYRFGDNEVYGGDKDITPAEFYKLTEKSSVSGFCIISTF